MRATIVLCTLCLWNCKELPTSHALDQIKLSLIKAEIDYSDSQASFRPPEMYLTLRIVNSSKENVYIDLNCMDKSSCPLNLVSYCEEKYFVTPLHNITKNQYFVEAHSEDTINVKALHLDLSRQADSCEQSHINGYLKQMVRNGQIVYRGAVKEPVEYRNINYLAIDSLKAEYTDMSQLIDFSDKN